MAALQIFYNPSTGLWDKAEWWHAANALETTIDYSRITKTLTYRTNIFNTFEKHKQREFFSPWFYDDDGWWALAWIKAYDLTGETRYLDAAKTIFKEMSRGWDSVCGGGVWWKKQERTYKNAITSELFLTVAARLHLRTPGDGGPGSYLDWAQRTWGWFKNSGMINANNQVNDGLNSDCRNNGQTAWTYNQGVILGGLVDLYKSTGDPALLTQAELIADAALRHLSPNGILQEPCETDSDCGADGAQFKGIFIRNLAYLYQTIQKPSYKTFITRNADAIWAQNRNDANQFGLRWAGPFDRADAARQSAAMDAINAAVAIGTGGTYQAENQRLNGVATKSQGRGFNGYGYVTSDRDEQSVAFGVNASCSGSYDLRFRYAAANPASRYLHVNGRRIVDNQEFPATNNEWNTVTVPNVWLRTGSNNVSVIFNRSKGSRDELDLDEMTVE
ncbi:hypothetical protein H6F43_16200 [Leptolyngbya sp. FACHB-36]|nr:hypothetical protein [Leptolyngbya sp. FACHB-36]